VGLTAHLAWLARRFDIAGRITGIEPLRGGHINEAWRIELDDPPGSYLLQRLNPDVFPDAASVMENIACVTGHLARKAVRVPALVPTSQGGAWIEDAGGSCWRMYTFITGSHVFEQTGSARVAQSAARAFGAFIAALDDYRGTPLHTPLPGFHDTPARLARLDSAARADAVGRLAGAEREVVSLLAQGMLAEEFAALAASAPRRIVHNDAKLSNVLLDDATGEAVCVVDLDTVMPGCALHDFGDMVRSMTTTAAEDEADLLQVAVKYDLFEGVARGFLEGCGTLLTPEEKDGLLLAGRALTLEQAARFLTDYLEGDIYYRDTRGDQNMRRARAQLRMFESLSHAGPDLAKILEPLIR